MVRRLRDPEFVREIRRARADLIEAALGRLADAAVAAVEALVGLLHAEAEAVRVSAARAVLEHLSRFRADAELAARIDELEVTISRLSNLSTTPVEAGQEDSA